MRRTEPPPLAAWILEHANPDDRNDALAGDLLEEFRSGRSCAWYWRQSFAAFLLGWLRNLRRRRALVVFAVLWSMLSPAWTVLLDRIENNSPLVDHMWRMDWPWSSLSIFASWMLLNLAFIWTGMLLFVVPFAWATKSLKMRDLGRALVVTVLMFNIVYAGAFILMNLLSFPGPSIDRRTLTPWGEVADIRTWAVVLRIPYFLTMLCALWRTAPSPVGGRGGLVPSLPGPGLQSGLLSLRAEPEPPRIVRFAALLAAAGLVNALIMALIVCRLPESHRPSMAALCARALLYVFAAALAGLGAARFYWNRSSTPPRCDPPLPFVRFALANAAAWVWTPAFVLLTGQDSPFVAAIAVIAAALLGAGMRGLTLSAAPAPDEAVPALQERELFAESLAVAPREFHGYAIAVCIYLAAIAFYDHEAVEAAALLAFCAFLVAWRLALSTRPGPDAGPAIRRGGWRLARVAASAVLVTLFALLFGVEQRNRAEAAAGAAAGDVPGARSPRATQDSTSVFSGYESLILWPAPEEKKILAPQPAATTLAPGARKPLIIRFTGPYWYFQPPDKRPGMLAHQAHGTPLDVDVKANNFIPLSMEAHQSLGSPVRLACCKELQVAIENRDKWPGEIELGVLLTDSTAPGKPEFYLGQQPIRSSQPGHGVTGAEPVREVLHFALPAHARIRKFDGITVLFIPDAQGLEIGPRIAVDEFELLPR
jgi:hypothetical protein